MPYRASRKITMRMESIKRKITEKQNELQALEAALEEIQDVHRMKERTSDHTKTNRRRKDTNRSFTDGKAYF